MNRTNRILVLLLVVQLAQIVAITYVFQNYAENAHSHLGKYAEDGHSHSGEYAENGHFHWELHSHY